MGKIKVSQRSLKKRKRGGDANRLCVGDSWKSERKDGGKTGTDYKKK